MACCLERFARLHEEITRVTDMKLPKRPHSHILSTEAEKALLVEIPNEWIVERSVNDYGIDYEILVFQDAFPTKGRIMVQLKADTSIEARNGLIHKSIRVETINYLFLQSDFAIIVLYTPGEPLRYTQVHWFIHDFLDKYRVDWNERSTVTVYFPIESLLQDDIPLVPLLLQEASTASSHRLLQNTRILARLKEGRGKDELLKTLLNENYGTILQEVLRAADSMFKDESAAPTRLATLARSSDIDVALMSFNALAILSKQGAVNTAQQLLNTEHDTVFQSVDEKRMAFLSRCFECVVAAYPASVEGMLDRLFHQFLQSEYFSDKQAARDVSRLLDSAPAGAHAYVRGKLISSVDRAVCFPQRFPSTQEMLYHYVEMDDHMCFGHDCTDG
jgi:Domain of unknown function (DUF4365)